MRLLIVSFSFLIALSTACSTWHPLQNSSACRELKRQILLNGSTSNRAQALTEQSQIGGLSRAYQAEGC